MLTRLSAAICGATILLACSSVAMARSEVRAVHTSAVDRAAYGNTVVGRLQCTIPIGPDIGRAAYRQPQASATMHLPRLPRFKLLCAASSAGFVNEAKPAMPWSRAAIRRAS